MLLSLIILFQRLQKSGVEHFLLIWAQGNISFVPNRIGSEVLFCWKANGRLGESILKQERSQQSYRQTYRCRSEYLCYGSSCCCGIETLLQSSSHRHKQPNKLLDLRRKHLLFWTYPLNLILRVSGVAPSLISVLLRNTEILYELSYQRTPLP